MHETKCTGRGAVVTVGKGAFVSMYLADSWKPLDFFKEAVEEANELVNWAKSNTREGLQI